MRKYCIQKCVNNKLKLRQINKAINFKKCDKIIGLRIIIPVSISSLKQRRQYRTDLKT